MLLALSQNKPFMNLRMQFCEWIQKKNVTIIVDKPVGGMNAPGRSNGLQKLYKR